VVFRLLVAALVFATIAASAAAAPVGSVVSIGTSWSCTGPVDLTSVTVTIGAGDPSNDGVFLRSGCTGYIGSITVEQWHGDGIKVGAFAGCITTNPCLEIGSINIHCYAHDAGKHQDGVQVMGGNNIRFDGGYIGCYSANDSQAMIHEGAANQQLPTNVIFDSLTADPAGLQDPTRSPLYHYGSGGAYGIANGQSASSGFTNLTLLSLSHLHDLYQGSAVTNPVWSFTYLCPGVRKNF
jgi:hypothetical protein